MEEAIYEILKLNNEMISSFVTESRGTPFENNHADNLMLLRNKIEDLLTEESR